MSKSVVYLFVSVFFLFASCEYQVGENFVEMETHPVDSVLTWAQFTGFPYHPDKKAYIVEESGLAGCELYMLPGYKAEKMIVRLDEMEWVSEGTRCDFKIDVNRIPNGTYELSCEVFAQMNNGTVAGQVGSKQYAEKRSWTVQVNARTESDRSLRQRVNEEGLIEIAWEAEESLRDRFSHYRIEFSTVDGTTHSTYIVQNSDFDKRTYADKRYAGEKGTYKVYAYFQSEADRPCSLGSVEMEQAEPEVRVEYLPENRVRLSWSYPYRSAADIVYNGESVTESVTDGTAEFPLSDAEIHKVEMRFSPIGSWGYKNANYTFNLKNEQER